MNDEIKNAIDVCKKAQRNYDLNKMVSEKDLETLIYVASNSPSKQNETHFNLRVYTDVETITNIYKRTKNFTFSTNTRTEEIFTTTYYEFPGNFTANLKGSKKFLQLSVGVSTQYDEQVMVNVESHQLALRSEILTIMSEFSSEDIAGKEGKYNLAEALKDGINEVLMKVEGFGGIENVHFTSFVVQ